MTVITTIAWATLRNLLGRRRTILLGLLAALPVLVALLARLNSPEGPFSEARVLDLLVVRLVLPLTALILGTAALGSELEDGTAAYVLTKPIPRWQVIVAKLLVAGTLTAALAGASALVTGLLLAWRETSTGVALGFTAAVAVGAFVYAAAFLAVSVLTSRALIVGLAYTVIWEAALAGAFEGTRSFSIREATLALADRLAPSGAVDAALDTVGAVLLALVVLGGGSALAAVRLARYEVRAGD